MCKHKSAWYLESGELVHTWETDGHEDLAVIRGIHDGLVQQNRAVRVEFVYPSDPAKIEDFDSWKLTLDESTAPDWWNDKKDDCLQKMISVVKMEMVSDERAILLGGCWIILPTAKVKKMIGGRIIWACGAHLEGANLQGANLDGASLEGANLKGAYLEGANLKGANLQGANLDGASLEGANLKGAYLYGAKLYGAKLYGAYLYGANLKGANLQGANLDGASLEGANLKGAYLEGAYLEGAYLEGAYLEGAYLEGAYLEGANLYGAHLYGAYLNGAYLEGAIRDILDSPISGWKLENGVLVKE